MNRFRTGTWHHLARLFRTAGCMLIAALGLFAAARPSAALQATLTDDTYTVTGSATSVGGKKTIKVAAPSTTGWVKFDLSGLPDSTTADQVTKATLRLYVSKAAVAGGLEIYRGTTSWDEGSLLGFPGLGALVANAIATPGSLEWVAIDVTDVVKEWVDTPASNFGLAIVAAGGARIDFDSKESKSTSHAAQLDVALSPRINSSDLDFSTESGSGNTVLGSTLSSGTYNVAIGGALSSNTDGTYNVGIGSGALSYNLSGSYNVALGVSALQSNISGSNNIALGDAALLYNTTGSYSTAIGRGALAFNNASENTAVGAEALHDNSSGTRNAAFGYSALEANTTASDNTAIGHEALELNSAGEANTAVGSSALASNTTGDVNTAVGEAA